MATVELVLAIIGGWTVASLIVGATIVAWRRRHLRGSSAQLREQPVRRRDAA